MGFKLFEEYGSASRDQATLRASGAVFLSNAILKQTDVSKPDSAKVFFDEETKRIGIQLQRGYKRGEAGVRKINDEKSGCSLNILPVLRFHNLKLPEKRQVFNVSYEEGMVIIDLSSLVAGRRGRMPKTAG